MGFSGGVDTATLPDRRIIESSVRFLPVWHMTDVCHFEGNPAVSQASFTTSVFWCSHRFGCVKFFCSVVSCLECICLSSSKRKQNKRVVCYYTWTHPESRPVKDQTFKLSMKHLSNELWCFLYFFPLPPFSSDFTDYRVLIRHIYTNYTCEIRGHIVFIHIWSISISWTCVYILKLNISVEH